MRPLSPEPTPLAARVQAYQVALERYHLDPDNQELYRAMLQAKGAMRAAFAARHQQV
jgi:hypothetical protein